MIKRITSILISLTMLLWLSDFLTRTPDGLNISLRIAKTIVPGNLNYSTVSGTLADSIIISNFSYRRKGLVLYITKLKVKLKPFYLLKMALHITQLNAENIKIALPIKTEAIKADFPFNIQIHQVILKNLSIQYPPYEPVHFKKIMLKEVKLNKTISINIHAKITQPYLAIIDFQSKGKHDNYHFSLRIKSKYINSLIIGKVTRHYIELQTHKAQILMGHLSTNVKLYFESVFHWDIQVDASHLNLRKFYKSWPQQLAIQLKTQGKYKSEKFPDFALTGLLKTPKAYLYISGQHHHQWNLIWTVNIADFSSLLNNTTKGTLQSHGTISGPTKFPIIKGETSGSNIVWPSYHIGKLEGHWRIDTNLNKTSRLKLTAQEVHTPFYQFLAVEINANEQSYVQHYIKVDLFVDNSQIRKITIHLLLVGNLQNQIWCSVFHRFSIHSPKFGEWSIDRFSQFSMFISTLCLHSGASHFYLRWHWCTTLDSVISGNLIINPGDAPIMQLFFPYLIQLHGRLVMHFNVSDKNERPSINNKLKLEVGSVEFPQLHIFLTHVGASINARGSIIHYHLKGYSQNQLIQVTGQTRLDMLGHPTIFSIQAKNLLIVNTHQYIIYGSGELKIEIMDRNINVTGTLTVHHTCLKPTTVFSHAATLSRDIVFINTDKKETPWKINTNIKIILGKQVILDSLGVKGRLVGKLTLIRSASQVITANGRITIVDGTFITHGHTLDINSHSSLTFVQSPIKNPLINIRVTRTLTSTIASQIGDSSSSIVVGFDIEGTLYHPEVDLYSSDSNLTQADILSYLIFGHPANANTLDNINLLVDAIDTLNIGGKKTFVGTVIDQITQNLGLTELGIEFQTTASELGVPTGPTKSAFVVGRYLSKQIYIRYSHGMRTSINIFQIRYLISKNLAIQTEANSSGNGVDILYSTERN